MKKDGGTWGGGVCEKRWWYLGRGGLGMSSRLLNQNSHPGRGAVQYTFFQLNNPWKGEARKIRAKKSARKAEELARFVDYMIHGPQDIYFPQRKSFAAMRAGEYSSTEKSFIQKH